VKDVMTRKHRIALLAAVAILGVAGTPSLLAQGGVGITVFEHPDYGGRNATFREAVSDLSDYHLNDRVSSFRIAHGETWEVCVDKDFGGRCAVFSSDEPDLRRVSWNEMITSMRPVPRSDRRWQNHDGDRDHDREWHSTMVLYEERDLRGRTFELDHSDRSLSETGGHARSVATRGGPWEICEQPDFGGRCVTVSGDVRDLRGYGMYGRVGSARPVRRESGHEQAPPPRFDPPRLVLYERPNFRGRAREVENDDGEISDFNDRARSARVVSGAWQICENKNFRGRCVTITGDVPDLGVYRLSSAVTSARPVFEEPR
jgi:hypothetical protein